MITINSWHSTAVTRPGFGVRTSGLGMFAVVACAGYVLGATQILGTTQKRHADAVKAFPAGIRTPWRAPVR